MSAQAKRLLSPEEYLAIERDVQEKHEFYRGEMFAMAGATREHNLINGNIFASLHAQLSGRRCEVYQNDMRVKVTPAGLYTYADVIATYEQPKFEDNVFDTLLNPQVIVEVLSKSTDGYDRGKKFEMYRTLESLREYLLVSYDRPQIDHYRLVEGVWSLVGVAGLESELLLPTIDCGLKLADVYAKVAFSPPSPDEDRAGGVYRASESR